MQLGLNKHLQPHEIKSHKHKIKNQTSLISIENVCKYRKEAPNRPK